MIRMTVGEFIKVTYIETGTESPEKLRSEGFGDILDDKCVIDEKAAQRLSERLGRSPGSLAPGLAFFPYCPFAPLLKRDLIWNERSEFIKWRGC